MELLCVFGAALAFYGATLAPTLIWGDSAWLTLSAFRGQVKAGGAADHPLYVLVGRLFVALPGDPSRNMALESAVFGALAVALAYRISRQLGTSRLAAAVGAGALAVSHAFWMHAVIPEVYTANVCFLLATITLALDWEATGKPWRLVAAVGMWIVGLTNHLVLGGLAPALATFVVLARPAVFFTRRSLMVAVAGLAALAGTVAFVPPLSAVAHRIWVGPPGISEYFRLTAPVGPMLRETGFYLLYLAYQFPSVTLVLGLLGVRALLRDRPRQAALLVVAVVVNAGVFIHHTAWASAATAKFVFYISDYAIFALCCAAGVDEALRLLRPAGAPRFERAAGVALLVLAIGAPPVLYAALPRVFELYGVDLVQAKTLPYRDNQRYFLNPNKRGYRGARRFAEESLQLLPPSAVIFADYTPATVLRFVQFAEQTRPDVLVRAADGIGGDRVRVTWMDQGGRRRPTFVASMTTDYYDFGSLEGEYDFIPMGPVFEVRPRE